MKVIYGRGPVYVNIRRSFRSSTLREAFESAVENGWGYRVSGDSHVFLTNGQTGLQMSMTAPDGRGVKNTLAAMRRKGALEV